jgi:hypothetical protein
LTIDELIAAHQEQIASLEKVRDAMVAVSTDRALSLKDVAGYLVGSKHAEVHLVVTFERQNAPEIEWTITVGQSWDKDKKEGKGSTLADAHRALKAPMSNLDKLSEEL